MRSGPPGPNLMGNGPMIFGPPLEIHYNNNNNNNNLLLTTVEIRFRPICHTLYEVILPSNSYGLDTY